jgi:adenylate cyclase
LRITAQASETESGYHLWSQTFARELNDVFAIQEEIAQRVGGLLRVHMLEARSRVHVSARDLEAETGSRVHASYRDLEAYTRYVKARVLIYQQSPETLRAALRQLRELIELFPDYAQCWADFVPGLSIGGMKRTGCTTAR